MSYCWGDPEERAVVQLDDVQVLVSSNAVAALRRMRRRDSVRYLCIDSVCIDRDNIIERSHQVAIMTEIYSKSSGNLIYLGEQVAWAELAASSL